MPDNHQHDEVLHCGFDPASLDGDVSALTIRDGSKVYTFTGKEAEIIHSYIEKEKREANKGLIDKLLKDGRAKITSASDTYTVFVTCSAITDGKIETNPKTNSMLRHPQAHNRAALRASQDGKEG